VKITVWAMQDKMSAVKLSDRENLQENLLKIEGYVNDFNNWVRKFNLYDVED